ncbi:L-pipecolate oxidase [Colletotrichum fructicola]|uniref:L-pipecolate oxidase n=2 Tax=Colletotrichum fructicola (strain Nara gc5) TaxID=1213859 RepID=A0A7J6IHZ0_COLFN|nr:L-pipecolate oxidase [Colletotrichum fructicola Nara gc5]KAF4910044.1 L-pipecolate oxidase [Colletotrichum fructicola]
MTEPTVLIVGAGTFGTSTAYHLAKSYDDPSRITVIDRWNALSRGPSPAAAIDVNRIIRTDYVSPLYCNLANEAIHPWFWDIDLGHHFHKTGWVVIDEKNSEFTTAVRRTFRLRGSDYTRDVDVSSVGNTWKMLQGIDTADVGDAYFNPEAGWCDAASATSSFMAAAERRGVQRVTADVEELQLDTGRRRVIGVRTADGNQITADKIVLATGAWTSKLLAPIEDALDIAVDDRVEQQLKAVGRVSAYYTLTSQETEMMCADNLPILVYKGWGILTPPSPDNRTLKVNDLRTEFVNTQTTSSGQRISVPDLWGQNTVPEKLQKEMGSLLKAMIPAFSSQRKLDRWRICWDAATPTGDWLLSRHPHAQLQNLHIAAGGNFSSYKFMPIVGRYICNVLNGQSNGIEKDEAWGWKDTARIQQQVKHRNELGGKTSVAHHSELDWFKSGMISKI